jgi:hypothetical protein
MQSVSEKDCSLQGAFDKSRVSDPVALADAEAQDGRANKDNSFHPDQVQAKRFVAGSMPSQNPRLIVGRALCGEWVSPAPASSLSQSTSGYDLPCYSFTKKK